MSLSKQATAFFDGFLWVDPSASLADVQRAILPAGEQPPGTAFPCSITTERKRVLDQSTGKRITRDWRTGHFLLWRAGEGAPDLRGEEARAIFLDAKANNLDAIIVHGQRAIVSSAKIDFRQFGVRDLSTIPAGVS